MFDILRYIICPFYAILHGMTFIFGCSTLENWSNMVGVTMTESEIITGNSSTRQLHMLGCLRGFNAALFVLAIISIFTKSNADAQYDVRQVATVVFSTMNIMASYDAYNVGIEMWYLPTTMTILTIIALIFSIIITTKNDKKNKTKKMG